jgi:hypothetical protein
MKTMINRCLAASAVAILTWPSLASAQPRFDRHQLRLRLGLFTPDGESQYWDEKAVDFTGDPNDFEDTVAAVDYQFDIAPRTGLMFSLGRYEGQTSQSYLDFVDNFDSPIRHATYLEVTSLTAGVVLNLTAAGSSISPYVGGGGGLYSWSLEEWGDFIDFRTEELEIFTGDFFAEGDALGAYLMAGIGFRLGRTWSFFAEGRWHSVDDDLGDDFEGLGELDLSGVAVSGGVAWRF